jgi:hypothetical protein
MRSPHHYAGVGGMILILLVPSVPLSYFALQKMFPEFFRDVSFTKQYLLSYVGEMFSNRFSDVDPIRSVFNNTPDVVMAPISSHTHGQSAADRSTATFTAERMAANLGRTPFFIQRSRCDERAGRMGNRTWYWGKDLATMPVFCTPSVDSLQIHVDTDYYHDMPQQLAISMTPTILYAFQPDEAAAVRADYSYTFDSQSNVEYYVHGGGKYSHPIWNYGVDNFTVVSRFCGIPTSVTSYLTDRRRIAKDRYLILLTPVRRWSGLFSFLGLFFAAPELKRLQTHHMGFTRLEVLGREGHYMSTARCGEYACATIPIAVDNTISTLARVSKYDLVIPSVESTIAPHTTEALTAARVKMAAAILTEYHRLLVPYKPNVVFPVRDAVHRYQFGQFDPEAKPSLTPFMSPFLHESYAPDQTRDNEARGVLSRITNVASNAQVTPFIHKCMLDFAEELIPCPGQLLPTDFDAVLDKQFRPSQRRGLHDSQFLLAIYHRIIRAFTKHESYPAPKDPRLISTINPVDKADYSKFIYPLSELFKKLPWYAFSRPPSEIAEHVSTICQQAETITNTDFHRYDGSISPILRELELIVLLRAFNNHFASQLRDLHRSQYNLRAITRKGVRYQTGTARGSGSPETALFNSMDNAFSAYVSFRKSSVNGSFMNHRDAWAKMNACIFGGDDGLLIDIDPVSYVKTCQVLGLSATVLTVARGSLGVSFLSRIYGPDVWFGDTSSTCDVIRTLSKFHTTPLIDSSVTPVLKLVQKARGLLLTDANTPIIGDFVKTVVGLSINITLLPEQSWIEPYYARYDLLVQYPNPRRDWMVAYVASLNLDITRFQLWLSKLQCIDDALSPPLLAAPLPPAPAPVTVVVDDETIHPLPKVPAQIPVSKPRVLEHHRDTKKQVRKPRHTQRSRGYVPKARN